MARMRTRSRRSTRLAAAVRLSLALVVVGVLAAGSAAAQEHSESLMVVVSIQPWADLVARVGGDQVEVQTLLPPGASPHAFEPSPSQAIVLGAADLVVLNGVLDSWLSRLLDAVAPDAERLVLMDVLTFEPIQGHAHADEDLDHDGEVQAANPHIWLDPVIAREAVLVLAEKLSSLLPTKAREFRSRAEALVTELSELDAELAARLDAVQDAPFVPFHDAWAYFARRYGLDLVATLEPFPGREPSARYVAETILAIREAGAGVIFDERQFGGRTAQVVAESGGLRVVTLDPIGGSPGPDGYTELLRYNAELIASALGGRSPGE